jgi:hypothetical protein
MAEPFGFLLPRRGGQTEHLAHERVVVGDVFQPIPVRVQPQPHDAQHEDLPPIHARASGALLASEDFGFQQGENLRLERRVHPDPLQTGEDRRQLVAAFEGQTNLLDGRGLEFGLRLEVMAHGGDETRMLPVQTAKSPQSFNPPANIRPPASPLNPTRTSSSPPNAGHSIDPAQRLLSKCCCTSG